MRKRRRSILTGMCAVMAALGGVVLFAVPASAHGAMEIPGSRTFLCYEDAITSTGQIQPHNPACQAAIANSGPTPLYNWFAVGNRSGTTSGETTGFIPDGKLCSGNSSYFDFSGFDAASPDWPKTHLTAGATIQIQYNKWAAHPGTFSLYITKPGWDSTKPLTWADMEPMPFSTATNPPSVGNPGSISSYYYWNATLPSGYTGYHIIYSVWARSDSTETFYGCSDVVFDGGNGQVTGIDGPAAHRDAVRRDVRDHHHLAGRLPGRGDGDQPHHLHHVRMDGRLGAGQRRDGEQFLERDADAGRIARHHEERIMEQRAPARRQRHVRVHRQRSVYPGRPGKRLLPEPIAGCAPRAA